MDKLKKSQQKYANAILFLCQQLGGSITGKKKLFKLLYYIDFDNYEYRESMQSITGNDYVAWKVTVFRRGWRRPSGEHKAR